MSLKKWRRENSGRIAMRMIKRRLPLTYLQKLSLPSIGHRDGIPLQLNADGGPTPSHNEFLAMVFESC
jgi:hypothetical protein